MPEDTSQLHYWTGKTSADAAHAIDSVHDIPVGLDIGLRPSMVANNPMNPRSPSEFAGENASDLKELVLSITAVGIRQRIVVTHIKNIHRSFFPDLTDEQFEEAKLTKVMLLSGHRRRAAWTLARPNDQPMPCRIEEFDDDGVGLEEELRTLIAHNVDAKDIGFMGRVRAYLTWKTLRVALMGKDAGIASVRKIAGALGMSKSSAGRVRQVVELPAKHGDPGQGLFDLFEAGLAEQMVPEVCKTLDGNEKEDIPGVPAEVVLHTLRSKLGEKGVTVAALKKALQALTGNSEGPTTPAPVDPEDALGGGGDEVTVAAPTEALKRFRSRTGAAAGEVSPTRKTTAFIGGALKALLEGAKEQSLSDDDWIYYFADARLVLPNDGLEMYLDELDPYLPGADVAVPDKEGDTE
jgi:hypothetical protein